MATPFAGPPLVGFADIRTPPIDHWEQYRLEGQQYLNLADGAFTRKKAAFTPIILYNIFTMAIEKLVMSALMEVGRLPYNHTMHDLVEAMELWLPDVIAGMGERLRALDRFQEICDLENTQIIEPTVEELEQMLQISRELERGVLAG
jgi:hypothetical protein